MCAPTPPAHHPPEGAAKYSRLYQPLLPSPAPTPTSFVHYYTQTVVVTVKWLKNNLGICIQIVLIPAAVSCSVFAACARSAAGRTRAVIADNTWNTRVLGTLGRCPRLSTRWPLGPTCPQVSPSVPSSGGDPGDPGGHCPTHAGTPAKC